MRLARLSICLLPLLFAACATVKVAPSRAQVGPGLSPLVRMDRAPTDAFPAADPDGYRPPASVALLLPMTGTLAAPSAGVRDGFLAAYYAETRRRPVVKFYDTLGTGAGALSALARARADGAQMIVGPLTRDEVSAVSGNAAGLPVIALNRGASAPPLGTTSFALIPEEEGAAAANRLLERGLRSALVFSNSSDNAQRALTGFREAFADRGGVISEVIRIAGETADLGPRLSALKAGENPPQAVLLALDAGQARMVAAQLRRSTLSGLPRVASSLLLNGANAKADVELDGIEYPELPWLLDQAVGLPDADALARTLPSARGPAQRLFAFGADAWRLVAWFDRLYSNPGNSIRGATGELRIDISGPVRRTPAWAVFSGGRGRPSAAPAPAPNARPPAR